MNARDFRPIFDEVLSQLPGFAAHKRLLLMTPLHGMLRGVYFEASTFGKDLFDVETFVMPLCVPLNHLALSLGFRIRHPTEGWKWTRKIPNLADGIREAIKTEAIPFLDPIDSAESFAKMAQQFWGNPHTPKDTAYVLARDGQYERAVTIIDKHLPRLGRRHEVQWEQEIFDDLTSLRRLLLEDPAEAQRKFDEWENYTIEKLGLQAFR